MGLAWMAMGVCGCGTPGTATHAYSTTGALVGGAAGALIGAAHGRPAEGAIAGALIGGAAGTAAGQDVDQQVAAGVNARAAAARTANPPLTRDDVIALVKAGVGEDVIVAKIQAAGYAAAVTAEEIIALKNAGVSDKVLNAIISRAQQQTPRVVTPAAPYWHVEPPVYWFDAWPFPWWGHPGPPGPFPPHP
jgi:hypothetical protein